MRRVLHTRDVCFLTNINVHALSRLPIIGLRTLTRARIIPWNIPAPNAMCQEVDQCGTVTCWHQPPVERYKLLLTEI